MGLFILDLVIQVSKIIDVSYVVVYDDQTIIESMINSIGDGYEIISAVATKDAVHYVLVKYEEDGQNG